jgi:anhydro-N-acetylmuramic acid kinase
MSGTSMDGIDAAVVDVNRSGEQLHVDLREFITTPYQTDLRTALVKIARGAVEPSQHHVAQDLCSLNFAVGEAFASAAAVALKKAGGSADLIGSHGQTICHLPLPDQARGRIASTLQIGEPAVIAQRTGITTVADFRVADVAAGGQGAPLVSYVDYLLLRSNEESRAALNIGGIANLTLLPAGCMACDVRAFDTGPGNMLIDRAAKAFYPDGPGFDRDGEIAARSRVHAPMLEWLLCDPYFSRPAPKTTGWEYFGDDFFERSWSKAQTLGCNKDDFIATLTELSACTIAQALAADFDVVVAAGGGVHNRALMSSLQANIARRSARARVTIANDFGLPADAKEAMAFAILAFETVHGRPNNMPAGTGARLPVVLGKIVPGANFSALMRSIWSDRSE